MPHSDAHLVSMAKEGPALRILMVLTSCDRLHDSGPRTGFRLEEFTAAYYVLSDAGADITLASPAGGQPPEDSLSDRLGSRSETVKRFKGDTAAGAARADNRWVHPVVAQDFCAGCYFGGHGVLRDLADDPISQSIIATLHSAGKPVALVGHGPAALRGAVDADGHPLIRGRRVTGTANSEEAAVGLGEFLPFRLQDELIRLGGLYSSGPDWAPHVVRDGVLITGQNPRSAADAARALLDSVVDPA
jgi:putative intracellular protease/amidase